MLVTIDEVEARNSVATGRPYWKIKVRDDYEQVKFLYLTPSAEFIRNELEYQLKVSDIIESPFEEWKGKLLSVSKRRVRYRDMELETLELNLLMEVKMPRVNAWCPHHGHYTLSKKEIEGLININGPRACTMSRFVGMTFGPCNEEIIIYIDGKKMANSFQLQECYETLTKIS